MNKTKNKWVPFAGWLGAAALAVGLALAHPQPQALGKVPPLAVKRLDQRQMQLPHELPAGRTLALVVFDRSQRAEAQSWIEGLGLHQEGAISWIKMPILSDRDADARTAMERQMMERHVAATDRARLVPVFTDRDAFIRAVGLSGTDHASVLVLDRDGNVLARVEGGYHEGKAQALRETILAQYD